MRKVKEKKEKERPAPGQVKDIMDAEVGLCPLINLLFGFASSSRGWRSLAKKAGGGRALAASGEEAPEPVIHPAKQLGLGLQHKSGAIIYVALSLGKWNTNW